MSHPRVEGTVIVEGLIEGRVPARPQAAEDLGQWASSSDHPLRFQLRIDSGSFSLLPDNQPIPAARFSGRAEDAIADALAHLLSLFAPSERPRVFSTLRSLEYRPGKEVQTLYAVGPDGRIAVQQQEVSAKTEAPPAPLSPRERYTRIALGAVAAVALIAASALVVDYPRLYRSLTGQTALLQVTTDARAFDGYFTVGQPALTPDGEALILKLSRTPEYPRNDAQIDAAATRAATRASTLPAATRRSELALDALLRGYVRVEQFDKDGRFLTFSTERIAPLRDQDTLTLVIPLVTRNRQPILPARVVLTY